LELLVISPHSPSVISVSIPLYSQSNAGYAMLLHSPNSAF
jgi:hypothetical protein